MKKSWRRVAALVLALCLIAGLAGCGDKSEKKENKTLAQELGFGYLSEYSDVGDIKLNYVSQVSTAQGKLYLYGEYYDEQTYENGSALYERDLSTGEIREIPLPELVSTEDSHEYIQQLTMCSDGSGYWVITNQYTYLAEAPMEMYDEPVLDEPIAAEPSGDIPKEAVSAIEEEAIPVEDDFIPEENGAPQSRFFAKRCDMTGQITQTIDLSDAAGTMDYFYCSAAVQNNAGDLYLASDTAVLRFAQDGTRKSDLPLESVYVQAMVATEDGTIIVSGYDMEKGGTAIWRLDGESLTPLEVEGLNPYGNTTLYPGAGSTVLMSDGMLLYSLDSITGQSTKLLSWLDSDINGNNVAGVAADGEDTVLVLLTDYSRDGGMSYELGVLTKTPADQLPERTILTLGAQYMDDTLQSAVIRFNRNSDTYRIILMDYSSYNTEDDFNAGAKQMDRDVIAGSGPDILSLSSGNTQKYIAKGALCDMAELMKKDGEISMDDLLSGPLQAFAKDGKIYGMPFSFGVSTMYASARLVGDRDHWTMAEMADVIGNLDPEVRVAMWTTKADFLTMITYQNIGRFVDYGKSTCNFNTDEFKQLLEASSRLPENSDDLITSEEEMTYYGDEMQLLQAGDLLLSTSYCADSYGLKNMYRLYLPENGIIRIGFPTDGGNGALLNINDGLAISARCKDPDGAWQFVKTMLSDDVQEDQWSFPVTVNAFNKVMEEAMKRDSYQDMNGETVYVDSMGYIGDVEYRIGELTQEQADAFRDYINNAAVAGTYDQDIMNIITEEAAAYFAGDKTAEEVADLIQNRVTIYLGETS